MAKIPVASPNIIDRAIAYFNPGAGRKRAYDRTMLALSGGYQGASKKTREMRSWITSDADADAVNEWDLPILRERSSDLIRNSPIACGAVNTNVTSVIGTGLKVKPQINREYLGLSDDDADAWESRAKFEFSAVAKSCDVTKRLSLSAAQDVAYRSGLEKGDCFALFANVEREIPYQTGVQLIEAEMVSNPNHQADTDRLVQGVEKDEKGVHIAYHVMENHPGSSHSKTKHEWRRIPARTPDGKPNMLHITRQLRIGQTRSPPYLSPVIQPLKQMARYTDAELMAAVVGGMYTVFVTSETDEAMTANPDNGDYELGNGAIVGLSPGEKIEIGNPGRPNQAFDPFVQAILRQIGVALEIPFEILIKHYTSSYSAARAAMIEAWRFFLTRREWFSTEFCQPFYEAVIDEGVALGRLHAPGYFSDPFVRMAYLGSKWIGDARGQIDEKKEADAQGKWMELGVKTLDQVTTEATGGDWEANHKQSVKEESARREDGLSPAIMDAA